MNFRLTGAAATELVGALNERARAGVDVRIAYHHPKRDRTPEVFAWIGADPAPIGTADFISTFDDSVQSKGIEDTAELEPPVVGEPINPGSHLMHSKYIIRDGATAQRGGADRLDQFYQRCLVASGKQHPHIR